MVAKSQEDLKYKLMTMAMERMNYCGGSPLVMLGCNLRIAALCATAEISKYICTFTKVIGFDEIKPTPPGTGRPYKRALPVPVVVKPFVDGFLTLVFLGV